MDLIKKCHLCKSNKEATYDLKDSIRPPEKLFYRGIDELISAIHHILNVSDNSPDRKICEDCHNELRRIYYFLADCVRVEDQHSKLYLKIKEEKELEIHSPLSGLQISPNDFYKQELLDEDEEETDSDNNGNGHKVNKRKEIMFESVFEREEPLNFNDFHDNSHPRRIKTHTCEICGRMYSLLDSLRKHENLHLGVTYQCRKCPAVFNYVQGRKVHERKHKMNSLKYECDICGWMFPSMFGMKHHRTRNHTVKNTSKIKTAKATQDEQANSTNEPGENNELSSSSNPADSFKYKCENCPAVFNFIQGLNSHNKKHKAKMLKVPCDICGWAFPTHASMKHHKSRKHTIRHWIKPNSGTVKQSKKQDPTAVKNVHLGETFKCENCPAVFNFPQGRNAHEKKHKENILKFPCDLCGWMFPTSTSMKHHKSRKHVGESDTESSKANEKIATSAVESNQDEDYKVTAIMPPTLFEQDLHLDQEEEESESDSESSQDDEPMATAAAEDSFAVVSSDEYEFPEDPLSDTSHSVAITEATYQCTLCPKKFHYLHSLRSHAQYHKRFKHKCKKCNARFKHSSDRIEHYLEKHKDITYPCAVCTQIFHTKGSLNKHQIQHEYNWLPCPKCPAKFKSERRLQSHNSKRHQETKFFCDQCAAEFLDLATLKLHIRVHTGELYECNECGWKFMSTSEVDFHKSVHEIANFICDQCNAKFTRLRDFNAHKRHHSGQTFNCTRCPAKFLFFTLLQRHNQIHKDMNHDESQQTANIAATTSAQSITSEKFSCDQCNAVYDSLPSLDLHKDTHVVKEFECNKCKEKFLKRDLLRAHRLEHIDAVALKCDECDSVFSKRMDLTAHKRMHSGDMLNCDICSASFLRPDRLKEHMRIHTGETFNCNDCGAKFTTRWTLHKHALKHGLGKPFACDQCDFKSVYKSALANHRRIHETGYVPRRPKSISKK